MTKQEREADFALAAEAAGAFEAAGMAPALQEHVMSAAAQGRIAPSAFPELASEASRIAAQQHDVSYTSWYWHVAQVSKTSVAIIGKHHAVLGWNWNNDIGNWDWNINTCNHGNCAASMSYVCQTNSGWLTYPLYSYFTGEGSTSTGYVSAACRTGYDWWSGSGTHNSNDDAWYEMWQIYNGQQGNPWGQAGWDNGGNYFACDCAAGCNDWTHTISCYPSH